MLIPIGSGCKIAGDLPEWAIVELQGDIERRPEAVDGPDGELDVGSLSTSVRLQLLFPVLRICSAVHAHRTKLRTKPSTAVVHKSHAHASVLHLIG
jgi:hypothetical protein